jgi:putative heme iron utilization protein
VRIHPIDSAQLTPAHANGAVHSANSVQTVQRRYRRARAYRNGELICGRVELMIRPDTRIGLAPRERRQLIARFVSRLAPGFRYELEQLVRRRGAAASRLGDRIETIELIFDDALAEGEQLVVRLEPPQARRWKLSENEFVIREHL